MKITAILFTGISLLFFVFSALAQQQAFVASGTHSFTTHPSVIELTVEAIGGGGGGGRCTNGSVFNHKANGGGGGGAGADISFQLRGNDLDQLQAATRELKTALAGYNGVFDIEDNLLGGNDEIVLQLKPEAHILGLTLADVARQLLDARLGEGDAAAHGQHSPADVQALVDGCGIDRHIRVRVVDYFDAFWRRDQDHGADFLAAGFFQQVDGGDHGPASGEHGV